jgi:hypothetical protein
MFMTHSPTLRALRYQSSSGAPDAERLGRRMTALYRTWMHGGVDLAGLAKCLILPLDIAGQPIGRACLAAAAAVAAWGGHPYHSALHHAEVATNATVVAELAEIAGAPICSRHRSLLLAAALAHDYRYQPGGPRFAPETLSAEAMDGIASECGVPPAEREDLNRLILATEPSFRRVLAGDPAVPTIPKPLQDLLARPDLKALAAVLSDADLLSSVGLSVRWNQVQHHRLEREIGRSICPSEDLAFFERIVGPGFLSLGGRTFDANLGRIREARAASTTTPKTGSANDDR